LIIAADTSPFLINAIGKLPQFSLFDYRAADFNEVERDVVLYLDHQTWVVAWLRNFVKVGYSLQGWHPNKVYPDFMVFSNRNANPTAEFNEVYVLETKGLHLKGNDDTSYKQELFTLCNELCVPRPWSEIAQEMSAHKVHFRVIFEDEWKRVINAMATNNP